MESRCYSAEDCSPGNIMDWPGIRLIVPSPTKSRQNGNGTRKFEAIDSGLWETIHSRSNCIPENGMF
uniref:Uncharacterized protein n=1 Tax=Salix viminalis TaxID=40686 RepID=A0A6N2JWP2_SALVM